MFQTSNNAVKRLTASVTMVLWLAMAMIINAQTDVEKQLKEFEVKNPTRVEVYAKILNLDPIKGDVTIRLEFTPTGDLVKEDGTLQKTIKFDTESANGKTEVVFEKGKRMNATEVVLGMYGEKKEGSNTVSVVEDYPFDSHKADLFLYFFTKPDKKKEALAEGAEAPKDAEDVEEMEEEVPHFLAFTPASAGYNITSAKGKESDDAYTILNLSINRSPMVKLFSSFIMILMWCVSLAVLALVGTVVFGGRKSELAMFSFIATLLFAFVTVRNSQPGVPPVGTFSDILSFFWAEGILGVCLLAVVLTWIFRKPS